MENTIDSPILLKFLGILFLIGMFWYFVFVVFKTNNHFLATLLKEGDRESREGFKNLKSKSDDLMKKIARAKDDKESYEDMVGLSLASSDDLRKKVSNYLRIEIDSLGAQATLALLNLDGKKKEKYKQLDKLLSRRENVRTLQKLYDDLQE